MKTNIITLTLTGALTLTSAYAQTDPAGESEAPIVVNVDNFNKAQTDFEFAGIIKLSGINQIHSNRMPTPIDKQNVIRMNRDTLYSLGVINISKGATVTMPDSGKRYMSLMVINNDGYVNVQPNLPVGEYEITVKDVPVKGFWSISLYNEKGYFQENKYNAYSLNSLTAKPNSDGS